MLIFLLSWGDYHLTICPAGTEGQEWEKGVGTGGYILENWEPGVRAFSKRNPNYWKEGRAHFDEIETLSIVDSNARTNALKTGQINYIDRVELKTAHLLKRMPGGKCLSNNGNSALHHPHAVGSNTIRRQKCSDGIKACG